jgi:hydroxymethylbilane synthase
MSLRIGTRGSRLALAQAEMVCRALSAQGMEVETVIIRTKGDDITGVPLHEIGGQGVFVRALDDAILSGEIDAAVHSMKDIPAQRPEGVTTIAVLPRESPADFLALSTGMADVRVVGTSSTRRKAQILRHDPAVEVKVLRGNVDTRVRRLLAGDYHAIILAEAGMKRLGISLRGFRLSPERFVPTANQGAVAVVSRDDPSLLITLSTLDHTPTRRDVAIERAVMETVGGGCATPMGIYCRRGHLVAEILAPDGSRTERLEVDVGGTGEARRYGGVLRDRARDLIAMAPGGMDSGAGDA